MSTRRAAGSSRNAAVGAATAVTVGVLFLFPTSTGGSARRAAAHVSAPAGVVASAGRTPVLPAGPGQPGPTSSGSRRPPVTTASAAPLVVNGTSVDTPYGPVQVQLTVRGGRILSATAIDFPRGGTSDDINAAAIPVLQHETVAAQNNHIDAVSGATYTSQGYLTSLQAALDAAHL